MTYNSLRDRYGSSIHSAPIGFAKRDSDTYISHDGLWTIKHRYLKGYQARHQWTVTAPDGSIFSRYTSGRSYLTLSDAVQSINESVAIGVVDMLRNLYARLSELEAERLKPYDADRTRRQRERAVYQILVEYDGYGVPYPRTDIASKIVAELFDSPSAKPKPKRCPVCDDGACETKSMECGK